MESDECTCDARFSGLDEAEWLARGAPSCICDLPKTCWECGDTDLQKYWIGPEDKMYCKDCLPKVKSTGLTKTT